MDSQDLGVLLGSLAEQQYMFHLLLKILIDKKILQHGELMKKYDQKDRFHFSHDLLEELVARGLKIDGNLLSTLSEESPAASPPAATDATDPGSGKKS